MRLPFRAWLEEQGIDGDSRALFDEAFLCYGVRAYRAALLLSYLGLIKAVAQRLETAGTPPGYPIDRWQQLQANIRDDNLWESTTFNSLISRKPQSIFFLDDDLRKQLEYWLLRRNDVAHFKGNLLADSHVDAFWPFIQSNFLKLVPAGGYASLLIRWQRHFDPRYTPPKKDFTHLVREITTSMRPQRYSEFLEKIFPLTYRGDDEWEVVKPLLPDQTRELIDRVLDIQSDSLAAALMVFLCRDEPFFVKALLSMTRLLFYLPADSGFIRHLWHDLLPYGFEYGDEANKATLALGVLLELLRHDMIPKEERTEAVRHAVSRLSEGDPPRAAAEPDGLEDYGFTDAVYHCAFEEPGLEWSIDNLRRVRDYVLEHPVDKAIAQLFTQIFPEIVPHLDSSDYYWMDYVKLGAPEDFARLGWFFAEHPDKYNEIVQVGKESQMNIGPFETEMDPSRWRGNRVQ